jgi:tetratricopeptide (TPR) repeat protein
VKAALDAVPRSGELRWRQAGLSVRLDRNADALEQYDDASRQTALAGRWEVYRWVATLASLQRDVPRTADAAERRVRLNLNDAAAHRDLASVYTKQGRLDEAFAELAMAVWLNPDDAATFVGLGESHLARRRDADAVEALQRAVTLEPGLMEARYALGQALMRVGRPDEGRRHLLEFQRLRDELQAQERRASEVAALASAAARDTREGQHRRAAQTWSAVIALEPDVAQHYLDAADALVRAGQLEEGLRYLIRAAELDGVAEVHLRIADVLARLGRADESARARQMYERLQVEDFQRRTRR